MKSVLTRVLLLFALVVLAACGGGGGTPESGIARIEITPGTFLFTNVGEERQLSATAYDAQGNVVETTFNWTSSDASQMSVTADGIVKAQTLGSVQITAEAKGIGSAPALIAVVETKPGTVLVTDAQVLEIGNPINLAADEFPGVGTLYDVRLKGVTAPAAGTIVMASETKAVAGKVVSSQQLGEEVTVRLEVVALPDLLSRYDLDWEIDLSRYDLVDDTSLQSQYLPDGGLIQNDLESLAAPKGLKGPLDCSSSEIKAYISSSLVDLSLKNNAKLIVISKKLGDDVPEGYAKVALVGDITLTGSIGIKAEAGFKGKGECRLSKSFPIPWGPWAVAAAPAIPIGFGVTLEGTLKVASFDLRLKGDIGASFELGFECEPGDKPCKSLDKVEPIRTLEPVVTVPDKENMRVELSASAYFLTGIDAVVGLGLFTGKVLEVTIGPKQSANLAFPDAQIADKGYASNYDLKFEVNGGPGEDLSKVIEKYTGKNASLSFGFNLPEDISKSPVGTLSTDKTQVASNGTVNFTVDLEAASTDYFLLGYNVTSIELYRKLEGESKFSFFKSIPVTASNQTRFQETWKPTEQDVGINEFAAFVKTKMPVVELEIAPDSIKQVEVKCSPGLSNGLAPQQTETCEDSWAGTASVVIRAQVLPETNITSTSNITWTYDPTLSGGGTTYYTASGSFDLALNSSNGCTFALSPSTFTIVNDPLTPSRLGISNNPPTYGFGGSQRVNTTITASCPGTEDGIIELNGFEVNYAFGNGPYTGQSRLLGTFEDDAHMTTWDFSRP
jgi:hypothetical protein